LAQSGKQEGAPVAQPQLDVPAEMRKNGKQGVQAPALASPLVGAAI
jgi:hypothetical protein